MKKTTFYILPVLFLLIISCSKTVKEQALTMKDVFPTQKNTDSTFVFDLDTIEKIINNKVLYCKKIEGKDQFVRTNLNYLPINLFFALYCRATLFCPKGRNIIEVEGNFKQDSTFFSNRLLLEVNSFSKLLKKQFLNRGKNPEYADSPNKSLIILKYNDLTKKSKERVSKALDTISVSYFNFINSFQKQNIDSLKRVYPLQILLEIDFALFEGKGNQIQLPPPPQPAPLEIVE